MTVGSVRKGTLITRRRSRLNVNTRDMRGDDDNRSVLRRDRTNDGPPELMHANNRKYNYTYTHMNAAENLGPGTNAYPGIYLAGIVIVS